MFRRIEEHRAATKARVDNYDPETASCTLPVLYRVFLWCRLSVGGSGLLSVFISAVLRCTNRRRAKNKVNKWGPISLVQILENCASFGLRSTKRLSSGRPNKKKESVNKSDKESPRQQLVCFSVFPLLLVPLLDY